MFVTSPAWSYILRPPGLISLHRSCRKQSHPSHKPHPVVLISVLWIVDRVAFFRERVSELRASALTQEQINELIQEYATPLGPNIWPQPPCPVVRV